MFLWVQQRLIYVHEKLRDLHLRCHVIKMVKLRNFASVFHMLFV